MPAPSFRGGASRRYKCCAPRSRMRGANCRGVLSVRFCTVTVETPIAMCRSCSCSLSSHIFRSRSMDSLSLPWLEVRALPHESGPSSCARGSPHWVLLETKTSRRRNALRSCSRTQNVKLRLSTWSGSTKTERSQVGVTRVPGISSRPIRRRPSSVRTAASPPSTICPAGRPSKGSSRSLGRNNRTDR